MPRRSPHDKIIPLNPDHGKKERLNPEAALRRLRGMNPNRPQTHLLPVKLPYPDDPSCMLANVPKHPLGIEYVLEMQRRFPKDSFVDDSFRSCQLDRIELCGPHDVTKGVRTLVHEHEGRGFNLLKVPISGIRGTGHVEAANIVADPFGYDVFWMLIQKHDDTTFHTSDFGHLPISSIEHEKLWHLNFST